MHKEKASLIVDDVAPACTKQANQKKEEVLSEEDRRLVVAALVLEEMRLWPTEVLALIAGHPPEKALSHGVAYTIRAYMHKAALAAHRNALDRKRELEQEALSQLSPVVARVQSLAERHHREGAAEVARLKEELAAEIALLRALYAEKIEQVSSREPPAALLEARAQERAIKERCERRCAIVGRRAAGLFGKIREIEAQSEKWDGDLWDTVDHQAILADIGQPKEGVDPLLAQEASKSVLKDYFQAEGNGVG